MAPTSIVEDTERTQFCPQTDGRTDGRGETSIPPFQLRWSEGYKNSLLISNIKAWYTGKDANNIESLKIGSGNGLVPSGNKSLSEPILTNIVVTIMGSLGGNELIFWC